jgi:predicted nucleic-acid-binding Zn-ribbon protein
MKKCGICGKCADQVLLYKRSELNGSKLKGILELCNIRYVCVDCRNTLASTKIIEKIKRMVAALEKEDRAKKKAI